MLGAQVVVRDTIPHQTFFSNSSIRLKTLVGMERRMPLGKVCSYRTGRLHLLCNSVHSMIVMRSSLTSGWLLFSFLEVCIIGGRTC
jgi:hypothetical protein